MDGIVSVNGEIFPVDQAKISVLDRGFLFGDAIFEVLVAFKTKLIAISEHLTRLRFSAEKVGFELPWSDQELSEEISKLCHLANFPKTYLRIGITRGEGLGFRTVESSYTKILYALPAIAIPENIYTKGVSLKTCSKGTLQRGPLIKNPYYLPSIVAIRELHHQDFDDVLWVNHEQEITEASSSNIFLIGREANAMFIETPAIDSGLLRGVTRGIILKLLEDNDIAVRESPIYADELARFDEAFVCSTMRGIVPIRRIDDKNFESVRKTAALNRVKSLFHAWVENQIGQQFDWNTGI